FEEWLHNNIGFTFMEKRRLWYPLLREMTERGISQAKKIIKNEIISSLNEEKNQQYRYLLQKNFFKYLSLEDLEDLYDFVPKTDIVALRRIESLILKATLRKREKERQREKT
ncbi:MAG: hypothetical protein ACFFD1_16425, partial [Candidatus Thorarchaeota archaeon]